MPSLLRYARAASGAYLALALAQGLGREAVAQSPSRVLDEVVLQVTSVQDSSQYFVYHYRVLNSASSRGGVAVVELDLSAPRGTRHVALPFTGSLGPSRRDVPDHVPFGAIAPERWLMLVDYKARLVWNVYAVLLAEGAPVSFDSVAPGSVKSGFGVRSPYLPGVRTFAAIPTEQSCCTKPNAQGELPNSFLFRVKGLTVAPTVRPPDMSLAIVRSDLQQTCGPLRWIADGAVCGRLRSNLEQAIASQQGDRAATTGSLPAFLAELDAQHGPGKPVSDNAYWLLKVNGEYLLAHM